MKIVIIQIEGKEWLELKIKQIGIIQVMNNKKRKEGKAYVHDPLPFVFQEIDNLNISHKEGLNRLPYFLKTLFIHFSVYNYEITFVFSGKH